MAAGHSRWWEETHRPDVMNQLCRVCGEPAAGFHFGAFTCEGCKSFFGRTYNNLGSISECKNNGECVINKKNRTSCKACRLRKCLSVGMSKSGSRYGRRSNWFKIHCLLQEQNQSGMPHNKWDEDNNNTLKDASSSPPALSPGMWRLPLPLGNIPFLGFPPPLPPLFLPPRPPPTLPPPPPLHPPSSLDVLRSLGPVQECPMDLSSPRQRTSTVNASESSSNSSNSAILPSCSKTLQSNGGEETPATIVKRLV